MIKAYSTLLFLFLLWLLACEESRPGGSNYISADHPLIRYTGRFDFSQSGQAQMAWPATSIEFLFEGDDFDILIEQLNRSTRKLSYRPVSWYLLEIDGIRSDSFEVRKGQRNFPVHKRLKKGIHHVRITKRTEAECGVGRFSGIRFFHGGKLLELPARPARRIEFYGNSITCGFGNLGEDQYCAFRPETEDATQSYAAFAAQALGAEFHTICYSGRGIVQNYDRTNDRTLHALMDRISPFEPQKTWDFSSWVPQVVVINIGTNDFAHQNPDSIRFISTYYDFIQRLRRYYPAASFICLTGPMMTDRPAARKPLQSLKNDLKGLQQKLLEEGFERLYLLNLTSQGPLGYGCAWHPNVAQQRLNGQELARFIETKMNWD